VLLALLAGAGLRISEALELLWRHVDLGTRTLHVVGSKTSAGVRAVDLTVTLRQELVALLATSRFTGPDDHVLATSTGRKQNPSNLRRDVLRPASRRRTSARQRRDRGDRGDHVSLTAQDIREPTLRVRR
jgi:integrase